MKTTYIYLGSNIFQMNQFKSELNPIKVKVCRDVASAKAYLEKDIDIKAIIFEAQHETAAVLDHVLLFSRLKERDILVFMVGNIRSQNSFSIHRWPHHNLLDRYVNKFFSARREIGSLGTDIPHISKMIKSHTNPKSQGLQKDKTGSKNKVIPVWKRTFDMLFSVFAIICLSPLLLLTAIAIKLESKGPVFYTSKRVGTGYRIFDFYKFRSMYANADKKVDALLAQNQYGRSMHSKEIKTAPHKNSNEPLLISEDRMIPESDFIEKERNRREASFFKVSNDPRITKVGRIIRNTSIDELLQLFNILKGDMSVVGNRPLPLYEAETLTSDQWIERFLAPAGLTGLWQVSKRAKSAAMSPDERKQLDIDYSRNYSFKGDLKIILQTIPALLQHENV